MSQAIIAAQGALFVTDSKMQTTGQWTKYSSEVYARSNSNVQLAVRRILSAAGLEVESLNAKAMEVSTSMSNYIDLTSVYAMIDQAAAQLGVSDMAEAVKGFVRLESPIKNGKVKVNAVNGSSMGIFQFQKAAWKDSGALLDKRGIRHESDYSKGVFQPNENVLKGVAYAVLNARQIRAAGAAVSAEHLYLAHNQGAGFFTRGYVTGYDLQSNEVRAMIKKSVQSRGITPVFRGSHAKW